LWGTITQPGMEPFDFACQEGTSFNKTIQIVGHDSEALDILWVWDWELLTIVSQ